MALLDKGRVCRKTRGRDAFEYGVITGKGKDGLTFVNAKGVESKVSGSHLEPTPWTVLGKDIPSELAELKLA